MLLLPPLLAYGTALPKPATTVDLRFPAPPFPPGRPSEFLRADTRPPLLRLPLLLVVVIEGTLALDGPAGASCTAELNDVDVDDDDDELATQEALAKSTRNRRRPSMAFALLAPVGGKHMYDARRRKFLSARDTSAC